MVAVILPPYVGPSFPIFATSPLCHTGNAAGNDDSTWSAANRALFVPFTMPGSYTGSMVWWCNGNIIDPANVDIGVYNADTLARVFSIGSTVQVGAPAYQRVAKAFTLPLGRYYFAVAVSSATTRMRMLRLTTFSVQLAKAVGCAQMDAAFPLPATITLAALTAALPNAVVQAGFGTQLSP